jgi:hypothetical protein
MPGKQLISMLLKGLNSGRHKKHALPTRVCASRSH